MTILFFVLFGIQFRGIENNLTVLLKEIDENVEWITDTEILLKPPATPDRELVEVCVKIAIILFKNAFDFQFDRKQEQDSKWVDINLILKSIPSLIFHTKVSS